ncbi:MAG: carboxypeptidase M32 [Fimbriimonas sp.]
MSAFAKVMAHYEEQHALDAAIGLMSWDRQVLMPSGGASARTAQVQALTRMLHARRTSDEMARALEDATSETEPGSVPAAMLRNLQKSVDHARKLPAALVARKAKASSDAYDTWRLAKPNADYSLMEPHYRELFSIARETSECLGYVAHPYDALINLYEEGATTADADRMFSAIKQPTIDLVRHFQNNGIAVDDSFLIRDWPQEDLRSFAQSIATTVGFDFDRGRLDLCGNAFCSGSTSRDVRMTTRPSEHFKGVISSSLHEMGHGLYEQGSPAEWDRTPLSGGASLAVHESQSRLWENIVGRSLGFWTHFHPKLAERFPYLGTIPHRDLYRAVNKVNPTYIRVGADELTYNLHILIRYELEVALVTGALDTKDLPDAWNSKYEAYLGIVPPHDGLGCLQDVHWSRGSVGYFPTYSMGNLIGGQIWETLVQGIGDPSESFARGDFSGVLGWLQDHVYRHASRYEPAELVTKVTGRTMEPGPWLKYATEKYHSIYGL